MSVVAWDGKIMASDSAVTHDTGCQNRICKIAMADVRRNVPLLGFVSVAVFGVVGIPGDLINVQRFMLGDLEKLDLGSGEDASQALIASPEGVWLWQLDAPVPLIRDAKVAIGHGAPAALAAMFIGADAMRAVEITCAVVDSCAEPVQGFGLPSRVIDEHEPAEPPELHEAQDRTGEDRNG
jgi:hypothetical protein